MTLSERLKNPAFLVTFVLLVVVAAGMAVLPSYMNVYLRKLPVESRRHMREVSKELPSWKQMGQDRAEAEDILKALGTSNTITRAYIERNPPAGQDPLIVELHLAYYTGMVDTVPHVSDRCMVGGGWQPLTGSRVLPVALDTSTWRRSLTMPKAFEGHKEAATLTEMRVASQGGSYVFLPFDLIAGSETDKEENGVVEMRFADFMDPKTGAATVIGHFFIANHRLTPSANDVRQLAFRLEDDYAYYAKVQISTSMRPGGRVSSAEDFAKVASGFVSEVLPEVLMCLPDWVRLEAERRAKAEAGEGETAKR